MPRFGPNSRNPFTQKNVDAIFNRIYTTAIIRNIGRRYFSIVGDWDECGRSLLFSNLFLSPARLSNLLADISEKKLKSNHLFPRDHRKSNLITVLISSHPVIRLWTISTANLIASLSGYSHNKIFCQH